MSSNTENPPAYQEKPSSTKETTDSITTTNRLATTSRLAGTVRTFSIADRYYDYFSIVRVSDSSYHLSLTVDPTPLYRIELVSEPTKVGNIQIFSMSDPTLPAVAAAYLPSEVNDKTLSAGTVCTSSPTQPGAPWRTISRPKAFSTIAAPDRYYSQIPITMVPGRAANDHVLTWRTTDSGRSFTLLWHGPPPLVPKHLYESETADKTDNIFAIVENKPDGGEILVTMRGGGGIDFELSVIVELILILQFSEKLEKSN